MQPLMDDYMDANQYLERSEEPNNVTDADSQILALFPEGIPPLGKALKTLIHFPNKAEFTGVITSADFNGLGCVDFESDLIYYGFLRNSIPNGPFSLVTMHQGMTYAGGFKNGELCDRVLISFSDGSAFRGQFSRNAANGYGAIHIAGARIDFAGSFINSIPSGFGAIGSGPWRSYLGEKEKEKGACSLYIGDFCEGEPDGVGLSIITGADEAVGSRRFNYFFGSFFNGMRSGSGVLYTSSGNMLIGTFIQDKKTGLFMHIEGVSKQCELRLYDNDVCLDTYLLRGIYFRNPWIFMHIVLDLQAMGPETTDLRVVFSDFISEIEQCLLAGLTPIFNGYNNFKKSTRYPIIDVILEQCARQSVPCNTKLITDCRVSHPWIADALAKHVRYVAKEGTTVHYNAYFEGDGARSGAISRMAASTGARSATPGSRTPGDSMALSRTTSRTGERTMTHVSSAKLSIQQSAFMDKIDTLKSALLSCYDMLRFIFCIYRAQDCLLQDENTRLFSDQQTVFSIDVPCATYAKADDNGDDAAKQKETAWKIGVYTLFTPRYCKSLMEAVPQEHRPVTEQAKTPINTAAFSDNGQAKETDASMDSAGSSPAENSDSHTDHSSEYAIAHQGRDKEDAFSRESEKPGAHKQFATSGNYTASALLADIVSLDSTKSAQTIAGATSYDNELTLAAVKMIECNEAISMFTMERMLLEIFASQPTLATQFLPRYQEIKHILNSICKPSDEYLVSKALGLNEKYIFKHKDADFEAFIEIIISVATLLGPQVMRRVKADVIASPSSLHNMLGASGKTAGHMQSSIADAESFPLDDLLKYVIVPFGSTLLKRLTAITQVNEKAQSVFESLFTSLKKEDQTARQCLKSILAKLNTHDGMSTAGAGDLDMGDSAHIGGLTTTARASSVSLVKSQSSLSRTRLQNLNASMRRTSTPIAKLRDPSRSFNLFESALLGSLTLSSRLLELFRLDSQIIGQLYEAGIYIINPKVWSAAVSNISILHRYSQLLSGSVTAAVNKAPNDCSKASLFSMFKYLKSITHSVFVRKLEHTQEGMEDSEEEEMFFSENSSDVIEQSEEKASLVETLEELADQKIEDDPENRIIMVKSAQCLLAQLSSYNIYTARSREEADSDRTIRFAAQSGLSATKEGSDDDNIANTPRSASFIYPYSGDDDDLYEVIVRLMFVEATSLLYLITVVSHCYCSEACFGSTEKRVQDIPNSEGSFELPSSAESSALTNSVLAADKTLRDIIYDEDSRKFFADETVRCLFECITGLHPFLEKLVETGEDEFQIA